MMKMKKLIIRSNIWYDSLKEPNRFLVFFIPMSIFIMCFYTLIYNNIRLSIFGMTGIFLMAIWRVLYIFMKSKND